MQEVIKLSNTNFVKDNNVYIMGEFDESISTNIIPELVKLINVESEKKHGVINFFINSNGGAARELYALLTLVNIAKAKGILIITTVIGYAFSCASMLAVTGDKRFIYEGASHLMHLGSRLFSISTVEQSNRENLRTERYFDFIVSHYNKHTKMTKDEIAEAVKDDSYYINAHECVKLGFADCVIEELYDKERFDKKTQSTKKGTRKTTKHKTTKNS